jgi:hypothetical protein
LFQWVDTCLLRCQRCFGFDDYFCYSHYVFTKSNFMSSNI